MAPNPSAESPKLNAGNLIHGGRISNIESFFMVATALFLFDLPMMFLEWMLIGFLVNWIISFFAAMTFWLWFTLKGVSFIKPTRLITFLLAWGIDLIPGTSASVVLAFTWTVGTIILLVSTRAEDTIGISLTKPGIKNVKTPK